MLLDTNKVMTWNSHSDVNYEQQNCALHLFAGGDINESTIISWWFKYQP